MTDPTLHDGWLGQDGPAAIVLSQQLMPVEGPGGVIFPATFAASEDGRFKGGYNIDEFPDGTNVCLVDSVGSQANRIEPLFAEEKYRRLVPQVVIQAGQTRVNLLHAGHRAGDAIVRCSSLRDKLREAFTALRAGNAAPLASIAPTSLVFGVWDSRDTQAKAPRLVAATIRAFNVRRLTRSAQYIPAVDYVEAGILAAPADEKSRKAMAERGFVHVPASGSHGGIIADGGIRRDAVLHLAALRLLRAGEDSERTQLLRRYMLGIALLALTAPGSSYLRQGCNVVPDPDTVTTLGLVHADGRRENLALDAAALLAFATAAATAFGVGADQEIPFDAGQAGEDLEQTGAKGKKTSGKKGK